MDGTMSLGADLKTIRPVFFNMQKRFFAFIEENYLYGIVEIDSGDGTDGG